LSLLNFQDPNERASVLGPLFATEVKASIPVFGSEKFTSKKTEKVVKAAVKQALQSTQDPVTILLPGAAPRPGSRSLPVESLGDRLGKLHMPSLHGSSNEITPEAAKLFSSQELHDRSHYSSISLTTSNKLQTDILDNVMLRRAKDGYLFDCKVNKAIVKADHWLQDVWEWIEGKQSSQPRRKLYSQSR